MMIYKYSFKYVSKLALSNSLLIASMLCFSISANAATALDGKAIMDKVKWRADGENRRSHLDITLREKDGHERKRQVSFFEKDYDKDRKTYLYVKEPADVRSTAILINSFDETAQADDDIWLYIPALRKIKRLSSRNKQGRFVGSEFIFADMERIQLKDYTYTHLKDEEFNGRKVHKINAMAANDRTLEKTGYSRRLIWVDTERFLVMKEQYFDAQGVLLKELTTENVEQVSGYWIATEQTLVNHQSGRTTLLKISDLAIDKGMPDLLFSKQSLRRGPRL